MNQFAAWKWCKRRPTCEACKNFHNKTKRPDPEESGLCEEKCWGNPRVALTYSNAEAFYYYSLVENQVITAGMTGAILGIQHDAFFKILDVHGITDPMTILSLFQRFKLFEERLVKHYEEMHKIEMSKTKKGAPPTVRGAKSGR